jgi:glucan 1,3-beta-glucosidase
MALLAPVIGGAAAAADAAVPSFARMLAHPGERVRDPLTFALGTLLIALTVLALQAALGLVFDPRYRDFPFAALTGALIPFASLTRLPRRKDFRPGAEAIAALTLALAALYILFNETLTNWQAVWFAGGLVALAVILLPARDAPG